MVTRTRLNVTLYVHCLSHQALQPHELYGLRFEVQSTAYDYFLTYVIVLPFQVKEFWFRVFCFI